MRPEATTAAAARGNTGTRRTLTVSEAITALTAIGALVFTGLALNATRQQNMITEQGQYTDRYMKAVEQLDQTGPGHLQGRLGAIYALDRLAHDSHRDQSTIIEILSAFIRTSRPTPIQTPDGHTTCPPFQPITPDTQAALTVLGRRNHTYDNDTRTDLTNTCLNGTGLTGVDLSSANLSNVDLSGAKLDRADLSRAILNSTDLSGADLSGADLSSTTTLREVDLTSGMVDSADLNGPDLSGANLSSADLSRAFFFMADLSGADLRSATLTGGDLFGADLSDADLSGADLRSATLTGASHANTIVTHALTDPDTIGQWW